MLQVGWVRLGVPMRLQFGHTDIIFTYLYQAFADRCWHGLKLHFPWRCPEFALPFTRETRSTVWASRLHGLHWAAVQGISGLLGGALEGLGTCEVSVVNITVVVLFNV